MKQKQITCPYCGSYAYLRPASVVHKEKTYHPGNKLYICSRYPTCDAYVGTHTKNHKPLGMLANGALRHKRILAHRALRNFRQRSRMNKWEVYLWLQAKLGLNQKQTHIALFSEYMCDQVIAICNSYLPQEAS